MDNNTSELPISKAELARLLNVSRTYVTLLSQGKKKPSPAMVDRLAKLGLTADLKYMYQRTCGPLAQLAEQLTLNQQVPSSILGRLSTCVDEHNNTCSAASTNVNLLSRFLESRRQGTSPNSLRFYRICLSPFLNNYPLNPEGINHFLSDLKCGNAKHAYYRSIRALCNWAERERLIADNPIKHIDVPKVKSNILPSLMEDEVNYLIDQADTTRDKALVSLFADSGMRLSELTNVKTSDIDWENQTIIIWGKGCKQRKAPFTDRTTRLMREYLSHNGTSESVWHLNIWGIISILRRLEKKTGLPCNPHTFRRTFASNLHRKGVDIEHIMRLGGWVRFPEQTGPLFRSQSGPGFRNQSGPPLKPVRK